MENKSPFPRKYDALFHDQVQDYRAGRPVRGERKAPPLADKSRPEWRQLQKHPGQNPNDSMPVFTKPEDYERDVKQRVIPWESDYVLMNKFERVIPHTVAADPRYHPIIEAMILESRARQEQNRALGFAPHNVYGVGLSPEQLFGVEEPIQPREQYAYLDNGESTDRGVPPLVATRPYNGAPGYAVVEPVDGHVHPPSQKWFDDTLAKTEAMKYGVQLKLDESKDGKLRDSAKAWPGFEDDQGIPPEGMAFDADRPNRSLDGTLFNHSYGRDYPVRQITDGNYWR